MTIRVYEDLQEQGRVTREKVFTYTRHWDVITDDPFLRPHHILAHNEIPLPFDPHPGDRRALADEPEATRDGSNPYLWRVTVPYSSEIKRPEQSENPLREPAKISVRTETRSEPALVDGEGKPILNSAKDLIEGIERERNDLVISVRKHVAGVPNYLWDYTRFGGAVNSDAVRISRPQLRRTFAKGTLKFKNLTAPEETQTDNGVTYLPITFELHVRPEGWDDFYPNRGFNELVKEELIVTAADGTTARAKIERLQKILVGEPKEPPQEPVWLDKQGRAFRRKNEAGEEIDEVRQPKPEELLVLRVGLAPKLPFNRLPLK